MDPKCILFLVPNSGAEKWPISQQPVATCGLSSGKQHGTKKKEARHEQRSGGILEHSGNRSGAFWCRSGAFWGLSGVVLEHSGVVLMSSGIVLEHSGGLLDHSVGRSGAF